MNRSPIEQSLASVVHDRRFEQGTHRLAELTLYPMECCLRQVCPKTPRIVSQLANFRTGFFVFEGKKNIESWLFWFRLH